MRVLIAEDQNLIRQGLRKIISELPGIDVDEESDGLAAWRTYKRRSADLVLTDIVMPEMDGLELISRIREYDDVCSAVIISGYDKFDYAQRAMRYGVRDYLLKPVRRERILEIFRQRKAEYDQRTEWMNHLYTSLWNACLAGEEPLEEPGSLRFKANGRLLAASSSLGVCPQVEDTGYTLCRRLAEVSENTALFIAYGPFSAQMKGEGVEIEAVEVCCGQGYLAAIRQLAGVWKLREEDQRDEGVRRVLKYVNRNYMKPLSLQSVAEEVGLHPNYLSALFTRNMSCSFTFYLRRLRVEKAKTLLRMTRRKVSDIAVSVGFSDSRYFAKVFKSLTGITPQQYRAGMSERQAEEREE